SYSFQKTPSSLYSRPIQIHPVRLSSNQQWSSDLMRWPLPAPSAPNASGAFCRRSHHHHDLVSSAPFPVSPRRLLRPPPASPWMPSAASTPQGTRCTSSPAAAPHATHSSPSTRSTTTPFRRHEEIGYRPGRRIGDRKMQKIARQYMFSCTFES
uniref:Uncharacterized protein n=4 Tax=Aegilops tauschii subsp. strangulata TaxID=200361 RepID=A0A453PXG7_AEGTS